MAQIERAALHTPAYEQTDLTTCDREPIHIPGAIQPHGILLALSQGDNVVVMTSANTEALLGRAPDSLLGRPVSEAVGDATAQLLEDIVRSGDLMAPLRTTVEAPGGVLDGLAADVVVHLSGARLVVEIEPVGRETTTSAVSYRSARAAMGRLTSSTSAAELSQQLAREIRQLTGFDRVMVYRFDEQWNGEVVAEDRRTDLNAFLGLHYPASDIPAQARRLYTVNWTRLIADIDYHPVPLVPMLDPDTQSPLDLSHSVLRSVSPIHVEYLGNMGVTASMSVSLVIDGQLWGLIACHHYSGPHRPSYDARSAAEFLGQSASQLMADRERADERADAFLAQSRLAALAAELAEDSRTPHEALLAHPELLSLVDAGGAALWAGERYLTVGDVPAEAAMRRISALLDDGGSDPTSSPHLAALDSDLAAVADVAAGALRVANGSDRWLVWVRPEMEQVVDWGGDPNNKALAAAEGPDVRLSPRKSFAKWRQVVSGQSAPWAAWQLDMAGQLRTYVSSLVVRRSREQIAIAESLQRSVLLDEAPTFPGFTVAARYRPAEGSQLGGDWWDALPLGDGRVAFIVGDVAGHGVQAAAAMTQVRTALRAYLLDGHSPASCLDRLDLLVEALLEGHTATVVITVIDSATGEAEIALAGHPPPVVVGADGARLLDEATRPLLGVGVGGCVAQKVQLADDELLVLYSDGLIEERHISMDASIERLRATLSRGPGTSTLSGWTDVLLAQSTTGLADDRTIVVIGLDRTV
jgi:chemotaxis family two-component system sensor kinase Cph1